MTNKLILTIEDIQFALEKGIITKSELEKLLKSNKFKQPIKNQKNNLQEEKEFTFSLESILSFVGGGVLMLGVLILISSNWNKFDASGQVFVTLGTGVFLALSSFSIQPLLKKTIYLTITQIIASIFLTSGVFVLIQNYPSNMKPELMIGLCFGFLSSVYFIMDRLYKKGILTFQSLGFGTVSYAAVVSYLLSDVWNFDADYRAPQVAVLLSSIVYLVVAKLIWKSKKVFFKSLILNIGAIACMQALFALVMKAEYDNTDTDTINNIRVVLEHKYGLIFVGFYYLAEKTKSKVLLLSTSIGLFSWLMYMINVRYQLSSNLGITFMIGGLVLLCIGYFAFNLNKKINK